MALGNTLQGRKKFIPPAIQITSMMDMFTIIVFFLLFSYSDKPDEFDISSSLELPSSTATVNYENSLSLFLTDSLVTLEETPIGVVEGEKIKNFDPENLKGSEMTKAFMTKKTELSLIKNDDISLTPTSEEGSLDPADPHILLFCDKDVPFTVINQVIKSAGSAGFTNFQLAVMEQ